jgi:hypothetical protein
MFQKRFAAYLNHRLREAVGALGEPGTLSAGYDYGLHCDTLKRVWRSAGSISAVGEFAAPPRIVFTNAERTPLTTLKSYGDYDEC